MKDLKKVVVCKTKLTGDETDLELYCSLSAHKALRDNGFISSRVNFSTKGVPESIEIMFELSKYDTGVLPEGQRYAYIVEEK